MLQRYNKCNGIRIELWGYCRWLKHRHLNLKRNMPFFLKESKASLALAPSTPFLAACRM
jgi:hypothetical protein